MKHFAFLVLLLASAASQLAAAQASSDPTEGRLYKLNSRTRSSRKLSDMGHDERGTTRQWKEEDYEDLMSVISGQRNLRHRLLQQNDGEYQKKPYTTRQQTVVKRWQKIALGTVVSATVFLAFYIFALKRELSTLTQYIPLGYRLFPAEEENTGIGAGVQMG